MKKWLAVILATTCLACGDENPEQPVKVNFSILTKYDWRSIEPDSTYADDGFVYSDTTIYSFNPDLSVRTSRTFSIVMITNSGANSPTYKLLQSLRIHEGTYTVDTEKQIIEIHYDKVTSHPDGEELENYLLIEPLAVIELNDDKFVANFLNFFTVECSPVGR